MIEGVSLTERVSLIEGVSLIVVFFSSLSVCSKIYPSCKIWFCRLSINSSEASQVSLASFTASTYDAIKCVAAARTMLGVALR